MAAVFMSEQILELEIFESWSARQCICSKIRLVVYIVKFPVWSGSALFAFLSASFGGITLW